MSRSPLLPARKQLRLAGFDYASAGAYFITIALQAREPRFGTIVDGCLLLNDAGSMVAETWALTTDRHHGVLLDLAVVMPDHLHAILFLGADPDAGVDRVALSDVLRTFKSLATLRYAEGVRAGHYPLFDRVLWQRGAYDRILRNDAELARARAYIESNPSRWAERPRRPSPGPV